MAALVAAGASSFLAVTVPSNLARSKRNLTNLEELMTEMVVADREEARKEAILHVKGLIMVMCMGNPPTNSFALAAAGVMADGGR